ncbi:hypothetical protein BZG36_04717 [Bifiguratus adelaidae]|uniref:N-acetyltransferase domain-containing protein n=1 Tax=Bifiguratus adelaidae TaxID=1938954 RepID=A0A261XV28_9FUNG|nr:hypothetical protein BZG36_04717 [Bifiguratus adelaidae]
MSNSHRLALGDITPNNLGQLRKLNTVLFPVTYSDQFYKDVMEVGEYAKLGYFNDICVGAVCCRVEPIEGDKHTARLYMMTLGVLGPYRGYGLGKELLDHILKYAKSSTNPRIHDIYLHVQTSNKEALSFYQKAGFEVKETVQNYYRNIEPRDAYLLIKTLDSQ